MKGTTHLVTGISLSLICEKYFPYHLGAEMMMGAFLGSLMPDIDADGLIAKPGKLLRVKTRNIREFLNFLGSIVSKIVQSFTSHRGFFHWPIIGIVILLFGYFFDSSFTFYFGFGYCLHCFLDMFNGQGVPAFAPISLKKRSIVDIKYGGIGENLYLVLLAIAVIFFLKDDAKKYLDDIKQNSSYSYFKDQY